MFAIDFETYLISSNTPAPKPVCVSWYDGKKSGLVRGADMSNFLKETLQRPLVIAHNMKFELAVIYEWFPTLRSAIDKALDEERLMCSKINEQLLDCFRKTPVKAYSLADAVLSYFKTDISDSKTDPNAWRLRYSELDGVEDWPQAAIDYAISDSIWAYKVAELQIPTLQGVDMFGPVRAEHYLNDTGMYGLRVDQDRVSLLEDEILEKLAAPRDALISYGMMTLGKNGKYKKKSKAFREYIEQTIPKDAILFTAKGGVSTSAESIEKYNTENNPIFTNYLVLMEYDKVLSSFVSRLRQADPYIRTEYNGIVKTGRSSSRTSDLFPSVNIQQMPRKVRDVTYDVRNCYIPRDGYKICSIDYSGLELISAAYQLGNYYGSSKLKDTMNSGTKPMDMHSLLAHRIMTMKSGKIVTYDDFVKNKKVDEYAVMRQITKAVNLGIPGGLGYKTMRSQLLKEGVVTKYKVISTAPYESTIRHDLRKFKGDIPNLRCERTGRYSYSLVYDELVTLKEELFALYPEMGTFLREDHLEFTTGEKKRVKNDFGEWEWEDMYAYQVGGFKRSYCTYTEFCNGFLMQSPSAVGAKRAMANTVKKYRAGDEVKCLAFIHDEIVFEVKDCARMLDLVKDVAYIMIDSMQETLPGIRVAVEADVMDYWKKSGGFHVETFFKDPIENKKVQS
jgi:hypothetical protein